MAVPRLLPGDLPPAGTPAALYIRVSTGAQAGADRQSPAVQRAELLALCATHGWPVALICEDVGRRHTLTREGYVALLDAVRPPRREIGVVCVAMHDRLASGTEWLSRLDEMDKLGVRVVSVREGVVEHDMMRYVRAGMQREESRRLALRVGPTRRASAMQGIHMGRTPYGYTRVYPAQTDAARRAPGQLVIDPLEAPVVVEIYTRYLAGESRLALARWLGADPRVPLPRRRGGWTEGTVWYMLRNPVYAGLVRYGHRPQGQYEPGDPADVLVVPGRHEAIVERDVWEAVQVRLTGRNINHQDVRPLRGERGAADLLRCPDCGGKMLASRVYRRMDPDGTQALRYECAATRRGARACPTPGTPGRVVHAALVRALSRLSVPAIAYVPPTPAAAPAGPAREIQRLQSAIARDEAALEGQARALAALGELTPEALAAFSRVSNATAEHLSALRARLAEVALARPTPVATRTQIHALVRASLATQLPDAGLVETVTLAALLIEQATITARVPTINCRWCRLEVTWSEPVRALLDEGALVLEAEGPVYEQTRAQLRSSTKARRHRARVRAAQGVTPTVSSY